MEFNSTVGWSDSDFITVEKLQAMVNNDNYLYRRVVNWSFRGLEQVPVQSAANLRILSGITVMGGEDRTTISTVVEFGDFFSHSCHPVVTATLATQDRVRTFVTIMGLDGTQNISRDGMRIWLAHQEGIQLSFNKEQRVHWHATGW